MVMKALSGKGVGSGGIGGNYDSGQLTPSSSGTTKTLSFTPKTVAFFDMSDTNGGVMYIANSDYGKNKVIYKSSYSATPTDTDLPTSGYGDIQIITNGFTITVPNSHYEKVGYYIAYD